jgi:hypothetical protein
MTVFDCLAQALAKAKSLNSGTLSYVSGSTTVTAKVYTGWLRDQSRNMEDAGYEATYDNLYVMASPEDVSNWGLQPMTSQVTVDGVAYLIGKTINKTSAYWSIWLRTRN